MSKLFTNKHKFLSIYWLALQLFAIGCIFYVSPALANDEDLRSIELYTGDQSEVVSSGRSPRPASLTAENVTVVTAAEIAALNAHTLADILRVIPGVQTTMFRTPGTVAPVMIQGSKSNHVLVLVDNVPINNLSDDTSDVSSIPAQIIERVEVVKGAASSAWGSALGGVINVITKVPSTEKPAAGELSASLGKSNTVDDRGEVGGTVRDAGYYLSGGRLHSSGLLPNNHVTLDDAYGKLRLDLSNRTSVTISSLYTNNTSGQGITSPTPIGPIDNDQSFRQVLASGTVESRPSDRLSLEGSIRARLMDEAVWGTAGGQTLGRNQSDETSVYLSFNSAWNEEHNRLSAGFDYEHAQLQMEVSQFLPRAAHSTFDRSAERLGVYINDAITFGRLALIPSARYDHTGTGGELFSPSFGVTYSLTENSVVRGYTGRGYSINSLGLQNNTEKVWTSQVGFETGDLPFVWVKGTLFRNDTWNIGYTGPKQRQLKRGLELELKTLPLFHSSLSAGYTYIDSEIEDTEQQVPEVPRSSAKIGFTYDDPRYFRALLTGNYVRWNPSQPRDSIADDFLWDLHVGKTFKPGESTEIELFFSVHNVFGGHQYLYSGYVTPGRWAEAGFRCRF